MKVLKGHYSPETAYVVADYPYGFRLRCSIRFWVEYKRKKGCRMVSQTTNPKRGNTWNKPKASTYARFGLVMGIDENGHVHNIAGCNEYDSAKECAQFQLAYADALPCDEAREVLAAWIKRKLDFEAQKATGKLAIVTTCTSDEGQSQTRTVLEPAKDWQEAIKLNEQHQQRLADADNAKTPTPGQFIDPEQVKDLNAAACLTP